ncbi:MAG: bacillithiol biosynthesis cysteine-adding enzyme BshC [Flavobacteriaceae bacterium]|nr:MAG: bacillithiol biosynthesis cysteine-adding enzyme BshC [Flavobacteriaceae bacterium]
MKATHIPFRKTHFFSKMIIDYLEKKTTIRSYYNHFPDIKGFAKQIQEKSISSKYPEHNRKSRTILVEALQNQYKNIDVSEHTHKNILSLQNENTYTLTTGHQLNVFTGPLYFLYKIISTINLCEELTKKFPENSFAPIYWMATEDHDFEEINHFYFRGKKIRWNRPSGGPVGRFSTEGLTQVFEVFSRQLGETKNANYLKTLFKKAYTTHSNLASATRYIVNELFKDYGLVIINGDDMNLKKQFSPFIKDELLHKISYKAVSETTAELKKDYKIQVKPREINLFYIKNNLRERIIEKEGRYRIGDTEIDFSKTDILQELKNHPERFSPNVMMRPLYQEVILPNIAYIGGGGELAYWLELKAYFKKAGVSFPILMLRNSVQVMAAKQQKKIDKLEISFEELFLKQEDLLAKKVIAHSDISVDFEQKKIMLKQHFNELRMLAKQTDGSFIGAVNAQERKQMKGLENLKKRWLRAEKRRQQNLVFRITEIQNQLLPNQGLEERQRNFSEYYLEYGTDFIKALKIALKPLRLEFTVLVL